MARTEPPAVIGMDAVVFALPRDVAAALRAAPPETQRWRDVLDLVQNIHAQRGHIITPLWAETAARAWADAGYPEQTDRVVRCAMCGEPLDVMHCPECDLTYGQSWLVDHERRIGLGLWEYPW